jgi:hypothetical protein
MMGSIIFVASFVILFLFLATRVKLGWRCEVVVGGLLSTLHCFVLHFCTFSFKH